MQRKNYGKLTKDDILFQIFKKMEKSTSYIKMELLQDGYSYKIWARNAYVGIWIKEENCFLVSRYKVGENPCLDKEYHWDYCVEPELDWGEGREKGLYGTAKPLKLIGKSPFELKDTYQENEKKQILKYLDDLEENNPVIKGYNSLQERKSAAIKFKKRLCDNAKTKVVNIQKLQQKGIEL
jgi:hypothetical protein